MAALYPFLGATLLALAFNSSDSSAQVASASKRPVKVQPFRLFNPDTLAKPTAGYSQMAEVSDGKIIYIAG